MTTLDIEGGRLRYWDAGQGRPIVFIHGVGTSGELWQQDLAELADDARLIVYDRRGYGGSSESPRDWGAHADDAIALIEALDAAPAVLVGYSGGAIPALDLALRRPELVDALVLLDPAFNIKRCITPGFVRTVLTARLLRMAGRPRQGAEHWMRYVASYSTGGTAFDKAPPERREILRRNAPGIFADSDSGFGEHVDEDALRGIARPVTLVEAALSPPFLRKSCARLQQLMPQARVVTLERSGHYVGLDAREEVLGLLRGAAGAAPTRAAAGRT